MVWGEESGRGFGFAGGGWEMDSGEARCPIFGGRGVIGHWSLGGGVLIEGALGQR